MNLHLLNYQIDIKRQKINKVYENITIYTELELVSICQSIYKNLLVLDKINLIKINFM